ncbi:MAG: hypothetical protein ACXVXY_10110 [Mycobacteriaceae bacterium]
MDKVYGIAEVAIEPQGSHTEAMTRLGVQVIELWNGLVAEQGESVQFEHLSHAMAVSPGPAFHASALIHYSHDRPDSLAE